jgi:predicted lipid-binding transport protein (Tim44 family)
MRRILLLLVAAGLMAGCATLGGKSNTPPSSPKYAPQYPPAWSPIIYPNRGQTSQQEEGDKYQCYTWAKQTSGFDPMAPVQPMGAPPPSSAKAAAGGAVMGGAGGALGGLAIGSLFGQAGKGAAIGAIAGGLIGGMMRKEQVDQQVAAQEQRTSQQMAAYQENRNTYNRAFTACMEGKGYTVK